MTECKSCCVELKSDETDLCNRCKADAGWYYDHIAYNQDTDCIDMRKVKIECPYCGRVFAALLSKFTKQIRHFTTDNDGECHAAEMETFCTKCRNRITFKISCC